MPTHKSYALGFLLSILLTLAAYFLVVNQASNAFLIIMILAIVQLLVQVIFFLHINSGADRNWNMAALISTFGVILILVVGSLWIMNHLNYYMTPSEMNAKVIQDEGVNMDMNGVMVK